MVRQSRTVKPYGIGAGMKITFDIIKTELKRFVREEHRQIVLCGYMLTFLLLWTKYIFPFIEIQAEDPKIVVSIAGFVFLSLMFVLTQLPFYLTSLTYFLFNGVKKVFKY